MHGDSVCAGRGQPYMKHEWRRPTIAFEGRDVPDREVRGWAAVVVDDRKHRCFGGAQAGALWVTECQVYRLLAFDQEVVQDGNGKCLAPLSRGKDDGPRRGGVIKPGRGGAITGRIIHGTHAMRLAGSHNSDC